MVYLQFDYGEKVCYIKYEKGKSETHGLPYNIYVKSHARLAVTIGGSGGLFFFLKDLINETDKSNNEDTYLDQIRICNVHWHRPPSVELEGKPLHGGG